MIIIMRFDENNVFCPKYIDMYEFLGETGGTYMVHRKFFVYYSNKQKKFRT